MKKLEGRCKDCGAPIAIAEQAVEAEEKRGNSRPERCERHRRLHAEEIRSLANSHFHLEPRTEPGVTLGSFPLGQIEHGNREWMLIEQGVDEAAYREMRNRIGMRDDVEVKDLYRELDRNQVVIVVAPTGTGKSTYLPYVLLEPIDATEQRSGNTPARRDRYTANGPILVSQPRVDAAVGIARSVALKLYGTPIGPGFLIGYKVGRQSKRSESALEEDCFDRFTKLIYITDGSLLNWILAGKARDCSLIIIDEAHERNVNIDVILMLLKRELIKYPHLKLIVTSATIDPEEFLVYFKDITSVGLCDFSEVQEKPLYQVRFSEAPPLTERQVVAHMTGEIIRVFRQPVKLHGKPALGHILAFLPGLGEIERCASLLRRELDREDVRVIELYRGCPQKNLDEARDNDDGVPRIFLGTNIAETSLTFQNLDYVIDSGVIKVDRWNPLTRRSSLVLEWHSQAGCRQRWGRVGRGRPGWVSTLYTRQQFENFAPYTPIGVVKENLEEVLLKLTVAGFCDIEAEGLWLQRPPAEELQRCRMSFSAKELTRASVDQNATLISKYGDDVQRVARLISRAVSDAGINTDHLGLDAAALLLLCDRFGCLVEGLTVICSFPFLGRNLYQYATSDTDWIGLFLWDESWSTRERAEVSVRRDSLWADCRDDVDFVFKLVGIYEGNASIHGAPENWAEYYRMNPLAFRTGFGTGNGTLGLLDIRDRLLDAFQEGASDRTIPPINFARVGLLRYLINVAWPDKRIHHRGANICVRESDGVVGEISRSCTQWGRDWKYAIAGYYEKDGEFVSRAIRDEKESRHTPEYGFTCSFVVQSYSGSIPRQNFHLAVLQEYKRNQGDPWFAAPEFGFPQSSVVPQPISGGRPVLVNRITPCWRAEHLAGGRLALGATDQGGECVIDWNEAAALSARRLDEILELAELEVPDTGGQPSGVVSLLYWQLHRLARVDTSKPQEGVITGFFCGEETCNVVIESRPLDDGVPFWFEIPVSELLHHQDNLEPGLRLTFRLTRRQTDWWLPINEDNKSTKRPLEAIRSAAETLDRNGFVFDPPENGLPGFLWRSQPLDAAAMGFILATEGDLRTLMVRFLRGYYSLRIDYDTVESEATLQYNTQLLASVMADPAPWKALSGIDLKNAPVSDGFCNLLESARRVVEGRVRIAENHARGAKRGVQSLHQAIIGKRLNIEKNKDKLAGPCSNSFRIKVQEWIDQDQEAIRDIQTKLLAAQKDANVDLAEIARSAIKEESRSFDLRTPRYTQHFWLMGEEGAYIMRRGDRDIFRSLHAQRHALVKAVGVYQNKQGDYRKNWITEIRQGDELYLEHLQSRLLFLKSRALVADSRRFNLNAKSVQDLLLFQVESISSNGVTIRSDRIADYGLGGRLRLTLAT